MKTLLYALLALLPALALAQNESCPRIWRSGDTLFTDPAPQIQWLRDGQPIPEANRTWYIPPQSDRATYRVEASGGQSTVYRHNIGGGYVLAGYVFDELHRPVEGATVRRGAFVATTDNGGRFVLRINESKPARQTPVVVSVEKAGYWKNTSQQYISSFRTTETQFMLHTKRVTNRVEATLGGELAYRGFSLQIPPNAVQTESGRPYGGTILLSVEGARPTEPDFGLRMPGGDFSAVDESGSAVMLYSYGYLSVEMTSESGERLELRPGIRATLRFQLPYTETHRPDSVPLWHFDADRAIWQQEGWSVRNGSIYEGEVSHFSAWNCDVPADRATVRGRVIDCNGEPIQGGWVRVGQRHVVTDSLGNYWTFVPGGLAFDVWTQSDTLFNILVPAQQEHILQDLVARPFGGVAVYNPLENELNIYLSGNIPPNLRLSIDGGLTWTQERRFTGLSQAPDEVLVADSCTGRLRLFVMGRPQDCQRRSVAELEIGEDLITWADALNRTTPVYALSLVQGSFQGRWDLVELFPCLVKLNLYGNTFVIGRVPATIDNLTNLQELSLIYNDLDELPASIGNLTQLEVLNLSNNQLTDLPASIGNLSQLKDLWLSNNQLTDLPASIGNLTQLKDLWLSNNQLTDLPASIGNLSQLKNLGLSNNQLTDLPASIGNLTQLRGLYIGNNPMVELPASVTQLTNLHELNLDSTLGITLPQTISNLTGLRILSFRSSMLTAFPPALSGLLNLTSLDLSRNQLTDLPASIINLASLQTLDLSSNPLTDLPQAASSLTSLTRLILNNNLIATLNPRIENMVGLKWLEIKNNQLTNLPASIGNLSNLQQLDLTNNQLTDLPASIGNLTYLYRLYLTNNQLTDLPPSIANLAGTLIELHLQGNPIPVGRRAAIQAMLPTTAIVW